MRTLIAAAFLTLAAGCAVPRAGALVEQRCPPGSQPGAGRCVAQQRGNVAVEKQ